MTAMVLDNQGRHYAGSFYDNAYSNTPFSNPWLNQQNINNNNPATSYNSLPKQDDARSTGMSLPYTQIPTSAPLSSGSPYSNAQVGGSDVLRLFQDLPRSTYVTEPSYSSATTSSSYATAPFSSLGYSQSIHSQQQQQQHRKLSDGSDGSRAANVSFGELDASRGMLALSHQNVADLTPRNIYEVRAPRGSTDSYGFPPTHSGHSSMSAESGRGYGGYYGSSSVGSVDSATDYSSTASDASGYEMASSRTLPRPQQLVGANLAVPAPQSMMGQFSSKMSSNTQKKHKCKVCDKRFTRPSSLQTHMYSHTGEKPFACTVEGCGRHFSVVSNLRRHKKVHKGESVSSHSDAED